MTAHPKRPAALLSITTSQIFGREVSLSVARLEPSRRRRIFAEWTKFFPRS